MRQRKYSPSNEHTRLIDREHNLSQFDQSYKRVYNENLWNEKKRLSMKYEQFHISSNNFRKSPRNLEEVKRQEQEDQYNS